MRTLSSMSLWKLLAFLLIALSLPASSAFAGFESPSTISQELQDEEVVLILRWTGGEPAVREGAPDELTSGSTRFELVDVLKNEHSVWDETAVVEYRRFIDAEPETMFVLYAIRNTALEWNRPREISEESYQYLRALTELQVEGVERLRYFADYLEHPDPIVANDAWMEFGYADYGDVVVVLPEIDSATILKWILDAETQPERISTYGWMLGMSGAREHAPAIEAYLLEPSDHMRIGLDGVIAGYVMLTGLEGWELIEHEKLLNREAPFSEVYAAMQALRRLWQYPPEDLSRERLVASMRLLLDRPEIADLVISDLARWHDWSVIDQIYSLYDSEGFVEPAIKRAIIRYMYLAEYAGSQVEGDAVPEFAQTATQYLKNFQQRDPTTFESAKRYFVVPDPLADPNAPPEPPSQNFVVPDPMPDPNAPPVPPSQIPGFFPTGGRGLIC